MRARLVAVIAPTVLSGLLLACAFSSHTFLRPPAGQVAFGSDLDASNFTVINHTTSADRHAVIGAVGMLSRSVTGTIRAEIQKEQETVESFDVFTFTSTPGDVVGFRYGLSALPGPGHYVFQMLLGSEVLATGELDVSDSPSPAPQ
jgi:hypothetical protein